MSKPWKGLVSDVPHLNGRTENNDVVSVQQAAGLQAFALKVPRSYGPDYTTLELDERYAQSLEVREVNEEGWVPTLKVVKKSHLMVFLMAGEQLVGCRQNSIVDTGMMVGPMQKCHSSELRGTWPLGLPIAELP